MTVLVRCNKADDPRCPRCYHAYPHTHGGRSIPVRAGTRETENCGDWDECIGPDGKPIPGFRVRCVKVKEEECRHSSPQVES